MHLCGSVQKVAQTQGPVPRANACKLEMNREWKALGQSRTIGGGRYLLRDKVRPASPPAKRAANREDRVRAIDMQALETAPAPRWVRELVHGLVSEFGHATRPAMMIGYRWKKDQQSTVDASDVGG